VSFGALLDSFVKKPALVVGDLMLDEYHFGIAARISPEAPVMVIRHQRTSHLPGGAANVALNLQALGAQPVLLGAVGDDSAGKELERCLRESGLADCRLVSCPGRLTTKKTRIVANQAHQVLRMDTETDEALDPASEAALLAEIRRAIPGSRVVILSDYLKGVLTESVVEGALEEARSAGIPVVVNPKPRSLSQYSGASLIVLNRVEAAEAMGLAGDLPLEAAREAAASLRAKLNAGAVAVTLGEAGMAVAGDAEFRVEAPKVEVYDTAGAGDTVVATVALGLASEGMERKVFELAAQTAACVVRHVGVATPSPEDLRFIREAS
jgi:rfaE bifunctional protein kinase chain/domain